ncbi:MAG: hypothetical protein M1815_000075 [Lichina confinis]|nr:MAG: hypothetical protein M1815_000075 [Lichina confinis]
MESSLNPNVSWDLGDLGHFATYRNDQPAGNLAVETCHPTTTPFTGTAANAGTCSPAGQSRHISVPESCEIWVQIFGLQLSERKIKELGETVGSVRASVVGDGFVSIGFHNDGYAERFFTCCRARGCTVILLVMQ